tara:strand:+ start:1061 stop:1333 length:273 start_codon:yes stop_codon:yes gene_type:complete
MKKFKFKMVVTYDYDYSIEAPNKAIALDINDKLTDINDFICEIDSRAMGVWECTRDFDFIGEDKNPGKYDDVYSQEELKDFTDSIPDYEK